MLLNRYSTRVIKHVIKCTYCLLSIEFNFTACACLDMVHLRDCEPMIVKIRISRYLIYACIVTMFIDISQGQGNN